MRTVNLHFCLKIYEIELEAFFNIIIVNKTLIEAFLSWIKIIRIFFQFFQVL